MSVAAPGLIQHLIKEKLINDSQATSAINVAAEDNIPFVSYLVKRELISSEAIIKVAASKFAAPVLDLSAYDLRHCPENLIPANLIKRHGLLPLKKCGKRLTIAVSDPSNIEAIHEIAFATGLVTDLVLVAENKLQTAIGKFLAQHMLMHPLLGALEESELDDVEIEALGDGLEEEQLHTADETPIVRFVNKLLLDAVESKASDIHLEPYEKVYRIRFRKDGLLHEVIKPPINLAARISSRIKVMAQLDISEKRMPQDGRVKLKFSDSHSLEFRVSTLPSLWGEKIVLRILDADNARVGIDSLGFEESQKEHYLNALRQEQGLVLITGPTGSGKTISLYTGISILNTPEKNISSVEDPVEINFEGVNQVNVNAKLQLDFPAALRAFLRQDPDVIMIGEIRDLETAEIAIKAAQTGHMVLSSLHTNTAIDTMTRLRNMGIQPYNLAASLKLIISQRLIRCLCNYCKESVEIPENILIEEGFQADQLDSLQLYSAVGCGHCREGYQGRTGIYEVVPVTEELSRLIIADADPESLSQYVSKTGLSSLRQSALRKVASGKTSLMEANRLT